MYMRQTKHWICMFTVLFLMMTAYFVVSLTEVYADTTSYTVKVTASTLNVRSGPGTDYPIVGKLTEGTKVNVFGSVTKDGLKWYQITYNSKTAYISGAYTKFLYRLTTYTPTRQGKFIKTTNIRKGPSTSYPIVGSFGLGTTTDLYAIYLNYVPKVNEEWYRVHMNDGSTGYVVAHNVLMSPTSIPYDPPKMGLSITNTVYRSEPSSTSVSLGSLEKNSLITATALVTTYTGSTMNKWYVVSYEGKTAYVYVGDIKIISTDDATAFEAYLTAQGFPESYKLILRGLHEDYPKWIFKAQNTGLDWDAVLTKEKAVGTSLLSSTTAEAWKSFESGAYDFTKNAYVGFDGTWNAADAKVVAYYLDPRNFLNDTAIYQFMDHYFDANSQTLAMIRTVAAGSFLDTDTYASIIYNSGKASGVNPNVITSIIRQEQGTLGTSGLISGTYSGYLGIYNFFNIGAYKTSTMSAVERGLWWAKGAGTGATTYGRPWTSKTKSITGGALFYKENYLDNNQNTFYLKKFNVMNGLDNVAKHQYMTHILAAANEGISFGKAYAAYQDNPLVFNIPIYNNMPSSAVAKPGTTGNNDNVLNALRVIGANDEKSYDLIKSTGSAGFSRYTTSYSVSVPSSVTQIIVNGIPHNNVSYVSSGSSSNPYVTLGSIDTRLPDTYENKGSSTMATKITATYANIYIDIGLGNSIIGSYKSGTTVKVLSVDTKTDPLGIPWYKVSYDNKIGYIISTGTNKITKTTYFSDWMTGTTKVGLNVRKIPSSNATLLGTLTSGTKITIYGYVEVPNSDGTVTKWYMTSYKGANVSGGDVVTLQPGTNVIKLTVKSTSGQTRTYTVTVNRT